MGYVEKYYGARQTTNGVTGIDTLSDTHSLYDIIVAFPELQ
jgi:hypothetical protein